MNDTSDARSFGALVRVLWGYKLLVGALTVIFGIIALVYALTATQYFRGEVVLVPAHSGNMGGSTLGDTLGGLAALGILPADNETDTAQAVLASNHLAEEFIRRYGLLPDLNKHSKKPLTMWYAVQAFQERVVNIKKDARKGTTIVDVEWTDPATAARWANEYVALANELMRNHALEESTRNVAYLNKEIAKTDAEEIRHALYSVLESETKSAMLANGRIEYAFQVVDPAVPPERRSRPMRTLVVAVGVLLGFTIGSGIALIHDRLHKPLP